MKSQNNYGVAKWKQHSASLCRRWDITVEYIAGVIWLWEGLYGSGNWDIENAREN